MANSSLVVGRDMSDLVQKILIFGDFRQTIKILIFVNQKRHNSAYNKAKIGHESSLKSSVSDFSDGLTSFQGIMIFTPVTVQFSPCPPCNSFSRIIQNLIKCSYLKMVFRGNTDENNLSNRSGTKNDN